VDGEGELEEDVSDPRKVSSGRSLAECVMFYAIMVFAVVYA